MTGYSDSLRGYAHRIHQRDGFRCRYCGPDGSRSFEGWLSLSWEHLLPKWHPKRDDSNNIVTACLFSNTADSRYFDQAVKRGLQFDGLTPDELITQRLPYVQATRESYREFWTTHVQARNG